MHWLNTLELILGGLWLLTSFAGPTGPAFAREVQRMKGNPRAAGPALWVQRFMGLILVAAGLFGLLVR